MRAWFACSGAALIARSIEDTLGRLAAAQVDRWLSASVARNEAWERANETLRVAVTANGGAGWTVALEGDLVRLKSGSMRWS